MKTSRLVKWAGILTLLAGAFTLPGAARAGAVDADSTADDAPAARADLSEVRDRAESMPIDRRNDIDKRIHVTLERVDREATDMGQTKVAARLAREFGMSSGALFQEKGEHGLSWGELLIAHTLLANATVKIDLLDLASLREEGLSWGAIAFGLRFRLEDLEETIKKEGRVAMGLSK